MHPRHRKSAIRTNYAIGQPSLALKSICQKKGGDFQANRTPKQRVRQAINTAARAMAYRCSMRSRGFSISGSRVLISFRKTSSQFLSLRAESDNGVASQLCKILFYFFRSLSVFLSLSLSLSLSVFLSFFLSIYLFIYLFINLSTYLSTYLSMKSRVSLRFFLSLISSSFHTRLLCDYGAHAVAEHAA